MPLIFALQNNQPINPNSALGKELVNEADRMKYLNGRLDMVAGMHKSAEETREEEKESKKQVCHCDCVWDHF